MKVPFLDLRITNDNERKELHQAIEAVFQHGRMVLGPEVQELEQQVARTCQRRFAVGVNSGTDALWLGLKSLGIGEGDEVITTCLSFVATANAIAMTGAIPVFADIRDDLNIDPASVRRLVTPRTRAILPVHYTGKMCAMDELHNIAEECNVPIIEDASQAFMARYGNQPAGSFGDIGCFSFNPMKVLAACGEAGMVVTDKEEVYETLQALRYNGLRNREHCVHRSLNGRLDTLQAAVLLVRLHYVEELLKKRRAIADFYEQTLSPVVTVPQEKETEWDVYYTYTIQAERRDELKQYLEQQGIESKIQHPVLMPDQPVYQDCPCEKKRALEIVQTLLCIPAHEKLTHQEIEFVAQKIKGFYT